MSRFCLILKLCFAVVVVSSGVEVIANDSLMLLPHKFTLSGPNASQQLLVELRRDGHFVGQASDPVEFTSSNPAVVEVEGEVAMARGNGEATLTIRSGDRTATAEVTVSGYDEPASISFRNHVQSVFSKAGCNSGACHGAIAGKNGFKLSLRGYDSEADYHSITRQARGRRIVPSDPARSLLLTKPSGAIPHKGGVRFDVGSPAYDAVAGWIAAGAQPPKADDPRLTNLEMLPGRTVLKPGMKQQLIVRAEFSDGHTEDVTRWCKYTSTDESVSQVSADGQVSIMGAGEGAITAWYLSQIAVATISVPYDQQVPREAFASAPRRNFIDELVLAKLESLNLPPSPMAGDDEFLRRAFLDTIGVLPTAEEARTFLADHSPDKRDRLIESLLERPEFVDYWAYKWSDLLLVNSEKLRPPAMWAYYSWIRDQVAANTPWDQFARKIVTATGSTLENGASNFFVLHQDPPDLAETTSQAFLGMSIGCAKCHNHPMEKWTNDQYYGMANLYARVRVKDAVGDGHMTVFPASTGDLTQPRTGKPQSPTPLDGEPLPLDATSDRRLHLADWLVAPDNPYFSRAITNRIWANYFGVGLVEPVDDLRMTNPASNEELLAAAAKHLVDSGYDTKALMRTILQSNTYQRSSTATPENMGDRRFYSRYYPRRLMAEVLLDAISQASGSPTVFPDYPTGWRALQLPDSNVQSYFLRSFGRAQRALTCECERTDQPSMTQVLHISNGDTINQKLSAPGNRIEQLLSAKTADDKLVEEAYLSAVSRFPTAEEKQRILQTLAEAKPEEKRVVVEDLYWALLSSKEFLFNH